MFDRLDGLCLRIKEEDLSLSGSVESLHHEVSASDDFDDSLHWHSRLDVEWSSEMDAKWFVETFLLGFLGIFDIDYGPFLSDRVFFLVHNYLLALDIEST